MRVQVIQHVAFERPGLIAQWAQERGHGLTVTHAWRDEFPVVGEVDLLIVLGGPMGALDDEAFPWLTAEKHYLARVIADGVPVLGVCLGAQILATVIGGGVRRNRELEIGWYPVNLTPEGMTSPVGTWPTSVTVGHWHGDTFELPDGMQPLLSSAACRNQAFVFDERVVGLQFHLEWTPELMADMTRECADELVDSGPSVMSAEDLIAGVTEHGDGCRILLFGLLDDLARVASAKGMPHG